jgi:hypothetical protein
MLTTPVGWIQKRPRFPSEKCRKRIAARPQATMQRRRSKVAAAAGQTIPPGTGLENKQLRAGRYQEYSRSQLGLRSQRWKIVLRRMTDVD